MKIISLNTWGGRAGKDELLSFFKKHNGSIDIFCLQEIWSAPYEHLEVAGGRPIEHDTILVYGLQEISSILKDYVAYFRPHHLENYGLLTLVHTKHHVIAEGEVFVHKYKEYVPVGDIGNHARNIQYVTIDDEGKNLTIINFHGLWNGMGKTDSDDRLLQSNNILTFTKALTNDYVLIGDFNLLPNTKSISLLEESGMRNLVKEYEITSTRTSYYKKQDTFADYALVSKGVIVNDFKVLPDEVSDHSPLYLDCN